jgi:hypothetical protein
MRPFFRKYNFSFRAWLMMREALKKPHDARFNVPPASVKTFKIDKVEYTVGLTLHKSIELVTRKPIPIFAISFGRKDDKVIESSEVYEILVAFFPKGYSIQSLDDFMTVGFTRRYLATLQHRIKTA